MRRMVWYLALLVPAFLFPVRRSDLGMLKPVETILILKEEETVVIRTDMEDEGKGSTVAEALNDLMETAAGIIYLDTADYLLLGAGADDYVEEIAVYLKKSVYVCEAEEDVDTKKAARYLSVHKPERKLRDWTKDANLQKLCTDGDSMKLY